MTLHRTQARPSQRLNCRNITNLGLLVLLSLAGSPTANAQVNCGSGNAASQKLICLIPKTVLQGANSGSQTYTLSPATVTLPTPGLSDSFAFLKSDLGGELSQIPLASPASGIIYTTDPTLHVPVPSDQSLGPILTQRADTIGRHKLYAAVTYQYFLLEDVDGLGLKGPLTAAFPLTLTTTTNPTTPDALAVGNSRVDLKIHQFVGYMTFGLTDGIDVSVAVPVLRVDMRYTLNEQVATSNGIMNVGQQSNAEEATGIGDVVLAFKAQAWKTKHFGLAYGAEARLPSGDAENFLGSGTFGIKPFVTFTRSGKISPHFNIGYQFNGNTELVTNSAGQNARLPSRLIYSGGADWGILKRMTIAVDLLEQRVINSKRANILSNVQVPINNSGSSGTTIFTLPQALHSFTGSYNRSDGSVGLKLKPFGNLLITGNLLVKLDQGGLRERLAPMVGVSYTF
jgi:hypothetical protein